jgi:glyceraldehyde-3-phosphate dehydrogenase/erythrose-4-phosphate dehydrogenase
MTVRVAIDGFGRIGRNGPRAIAEDNRTDAAQTQIVNGKLVRVLSRHDNEWCFRRRMCDTAVAIGKLL